MEPSRYNHFIWNENEGVFFNAKTGSFRYMDRPQFDTIRSSLEFLPFEENYKKLPENVQAWLVKEGYIVSSITNERLGILEKEVEFRKTSKTLALTILPTLECNLRCSYCYQDKKKTFMTIGTEKKIEEFVSNWFEENDTKILDITWFGGEPLLALGTICRLSERLIALCEKWKVQYFGSYLISFREDHPGKNFGCPNHNRW